MIKVGIIGGGALGLICASNLSKNKGIQVDIIEKENRVGKKILQTGNGRCNFTNMKVKPSNYNNPDFVRPLLQEYTPFVVCDYFSSLGLVSYEDEEKRRYPLSDSANSVLDVLRNACKLNNVLEKTSHEVIEIVKHKNKYKVFCKYNSNEDVSYEYDYLVLATGGNLKKVEFIENMGLKYTDLKQSLCAIKANVVGLNGIRCTTKASLFINNQLKKVETGEVLFKDGALSGIVIFNLSAYLSRLSSFSNARIELDLLPKFNEKEFNQMWDNRVKCLKNSTIELFLIGLFPKMLALSILKQANINPSKLVKDINKKESDILIEKCRRFSFDVKEKYASNNYQVISGGISLKEVNPNLELVKYPNIYIGGELLNIDGDCGGFNLHFAFACGLKIAENIKKKQ